MKPHLSPLPGSDEAHALGCTCPDPDLGDAPDALHRKIDIDDDCPVHGRAAISQDWLGEPGPIDTEGDIGDAASDPELRRSR